MQAAGPLFFFNIAALPPLADSARFGGRGGTLL
jgi:hypothetical protein